jgi:glucose 1-dehydrogenase
MREEGRLAGAAAIVTGASSGIGYGIASRLAVDGAAVAINYHSQREPAEQLGVRSSAAAVEQLLLVAMSRRKPTWRRYLI